MDRDSEHDAPAGSSPVDESEDVTDSATPGRKPFDDTSESSEQRREHPGLADGDDG